MLLLQLEIEKETSAIINYRKESEEHFPGKLNSPENGLAQFNFSFQYFAAITESPLSVFLKQIICIHFFKGSTLSSARTEKILFWQHILELGMRSAPFQL